ncbi:MAG TPA: accessory factor UbiK family protein [Acetobacteraceae bacterium]|nr:accessory factor UbiK family protein [Acetobacteraceae bacterium]
MSDRPKFFDDLAGVAGGAFSALAGMREEAESVLRARLDEMIRRLELVRREELEAVEAVAAKARAGQEEAAARITGLETRLAALEARLTVQVRPAGEPPAGPVQVADSAPDPAAPPSGLA